MQNHMSIPGKITISACPIARISLCDGAKQGQYLASIASIGMSPRTLIRGPITSSVGSELLDVTPLVSQVKTALRESVSVPRAVQTDVVSGRMDVVSSVGQALDAAHDCRTDTTGKV